MLPVTGFAHVGYLPSKRVVGISKLARVVQGFARRLQIQEKLTADLAKAIAEVLQPRGVGVVIQAEPSCMTIRGFHNPGSVLSTNPLIFALPTYPSTPEEFLLLTKHHQNT